MKDKKGFTIIELLAVFFLISIVSVIAVVTVKSVMNKIARDYYASLEENLLTAGSEYFSDNPKDRPVDSYNKVELSTLVNNKYIDKVLDKDGKDTCDANVYIYKKSDFYKYQSCLTCNGYSSTGDYCNNLVMGIIFINGVTSRGNSYSGTLSYDNTPWISDDYVDFTFSTSNNDVYKYVINRIDNNSKNEIIATNGIGKTRINSTGAYSVIGYNDKDIVVGETKYFNVKFDKNGPSFDFSNNINEFKFSYNQNSYSYNNSIINLKDDNGIKSVKYTLTGTRNYGSNTDITKNLVIKADLVSGLYKLTVKVTDIAGNSVSKSIDNIMVLMPLKVTYVDLDGVHNDKGYKYVINGQKYGYFKSLAERYNPTFDVDVDWFLDTAKKNQITDNTIVDSEIPFPIYAFDKYIIQEIPTSSDYCNSFTYDGYIHKLNKGSDIGFVFDDTYRIHYNYGGYNIRADLKKGFIWSDMTLTPKYINCNIDKRDITITSGSSSVTFDNDFHSNSYCSASNLASTDSLFCLPGGSRKHVGTTTNGLILYSIFGVGDASNDYNISLDEGKIVINPRYISCTTSDKECSFDMCSTIERNLSTTCNGLLPGWTYSPLVKAGARKVFSYGVGVYPNTLMDYDIRIYDSSNIEITSDCSIGHHKGTMTVTKRGVSFSDRSCNNTVYDGRSHTLLTLDSYTGDYVTISGSTDKVSAGDYVFTASLKDPANTEWDDHTTGNKNVKCSIAKKKVKAVTTCKSGLIYNGRQQFLVNNPDNEDYNVINSTAINANTYSVYLSLKDKINYMWEDGTTDNKVLNCTLNKKKASITARSSTIEYDGYSHTYGGDSVCSVSGIVDGASASLNCGSVTKTGIGVYTITAGGSISNNYDVQYINGTFTIRDTTKPYCGINADENGTLTISCGDTSGDIALCGWNSSGYGYTANMTVSRSGTYYGYVRDGAGNTNSCSKTVSATTVYRKATCASVSCSSYTGYGTPSVSNVKTCSSSGSYGISSSYTTCESTTLYYGTCKSYCCYGTKSNCSYTSAYNAGTGYYTDAYSAKNAASCSSSCSRTNLVYSEIIKGSTSTPGYVKKTFSGGYCNNYGCNSWNSFGYWTTTPCSTVSSSYNANNLNKCESKSIFS